MAANVCLTENTNLRFGTGTTGATSITRRIWIEMGAEIEPGANVEHDRLFTETGLKLGRILWYLLHASQELDKKTHVDEPSSTGIGSRRIKTAFGEEVGKDEIHWWVYKKDQEVAVLHDRVKRALAFVQLLKEDSARLEPSGLHTYAGLVTRLATFIESHKDAIEELHDFVFWLYERDALAPAILFTYRVWGSTRRSDRWLDVDAPSIDAESPTTIKALTEIACGVRQRLGYTLFFEKAYIAAEIYDSDPENYGSRSIPKRRVVSRTANKALKELAVFFEELRDSFRNIELDIERYLAERNLLKSESFWKSFITKAASLGRIESAVWDFKESLPMWHAKGSDRLAAQIEFCRLIAAFANRDGGAIIIGVTNDIRAVVGVPDLENRLKSISQAIQRWLEYPRKDAIFHLQPVPFENDGHVLMCLVVAVAQSADVVGVRGVSEEYYYPDRDQTGVAYPSPQKLSDRKIHLKAGDNFGFTKDLQAFLHDK